MNRVSYSRQTEDPKDKHGSTQQGGWARTNVGWKGPAIVSVVTTGFRYSLEKQDNPI